MSAIAFYDSGRLLPYRHDLKQKQIEQRNIDAENTRKYIGYAGGAVANMAESTGTFFGARLGSASQEKDSAGNMVDVEQKYGGGRTGAEYAKADWQKGTMDDENHRRTVTHRLGLLTENVKYSTLRRKHEAWGGRDPIAGEKEYQKKWVLYMEDVGKAMMTKVELMQKYPDLFTDDDMAQANRAGAINLRTDIDDDQKKALIAKLDSIAPFSRWLTYAEENKLYDPTIAGKSRPEVDLLMAYLKDEVKFPGINGMVADREKIQADQAALLKNKETSEQDVAAELAAIILAAQKAKAGKSIDTTKIELKDKEPSWFEKGTNAVVEFVEGVSEMPEKLVSSENQKIEQQNKLKRDNKYSGTLKERTEGLGNFRETEEPIVHDMSIQETTVEEENSVIKHLAHKSVEEIVTSYATKDKAGKELPVVESFLSLVRRFKGAIGYKLKNNLPIFGGSNSASIYEGNNSASKKEMLSAGEAMKAEITKSNNIAIHKLRISGKDGGELKVAMNKVRAATHNLISWAEAELINPNQDYIKNYKGPGGLDFVDKMAARHENLLFGAPSKTNKVKEVVKPKANIQASMIISAPTNKIDPASLTLQDQKIQAYNATLAHEDPGLSGQVIDDNTRAILGGSVDAWGIVGGDTELSRQIVMDVLKIKDSSKMRAFLQYFNTKDLDKHLGHIKKDKKGRKIKNQPALTTTQLANRKLLEVTPKQTKDLIKWAYDKNLNTLINNHGFLNKEVLNNNPSLHQLLGDMAYRHGGSFMTKKKAGYTGLAEALNHALNPTKEVSRDSAIAKMYRLLFKQGTYDKPEEQGNARYAFLKNRFDRFKENTAGSNVAYKGGGTADITLLNNKPMYKKPFNLLSNPNLVNPNNLVMPKLTLRRN